MIDACTPAPTRRSYWVVPHKLLAGAYPGAPTPSAHRARVEALWSAGVRTFINLMEPTETDNAGHPFTPYEDIVQELSRASHEPATCLRFPIRDLGVPTPELMFEVLDAIDRSLRLADDTRPPRVTYVHCFGGVGRTATVVCSWLLLRGTSTAASIFEDLAALRRGDLEAGQRPAPENPVQRDFVTSWAAGAAAEPSEMRSGRRSSG